MKENKKAELQKMSDEIVSGLAEWGQQNPQATFSEIERETMKRMGQLQARMMQELAMGSAVKDWDGENGPKCPECGETMKKSSEQERRLEAQGGHEIVLKRTYTICAKCGAGIFPPG